MPLASTRSIAECPNCLSRHVVDRDEDGQVEIPTIECAGIDCPALLCPDCPQFHCDGCGRIFCREHAMEEQRDESCTCVRLDVDVYDNAGCLACNPDLRSRPLLFCPACMEEVEEVEWPEVPKLEPVLAVVARATIEEWGGAA